MRKSTVAIALFSLVFHGVAGAGAVVGATEPTQILNNLQLGAQYVEQAQQTIHQFNQYQTMLQNLKQMTPSALLDQAAQKLWQDQNMTQAFRNLQKIVVGGQEISYSLSTVDGKFKQLYPGYGATNADYSRAYRDWSGNTLNSVKNALSLISAHSENFTTEQGMVNELVAKSQTAGGQLQALQAGNQISVAMVGQMQQLRQLQMAQANAQMAYMSGQQAKQDSSDASLRGYFNRGTTRVRTLDEIGKSSK